MRRASIVLLLILVGACASYQDRSALDAAKLAYVDSALAYDFAADAIVDMRAQRLVSDVQWARFKAAQAQVRTYAPIVRAGLDIWERTGTAPLTLKSATEELTKAFLEVAAIKSGGQP